MSTTTTSPSKSYLGCLTHGQHHDWRLYDLSTSARRRIVWYCTRCRTIEDADGEN